MELIVNNGKGYVQQLKINHDDNPLGLIAVDSLFSPVKKVLFRLKTQELEVL